MTSMVCPVCHEKYAFFEKKCTRCNVDLVPEDQTDADAGSTFAPMDEPEPAHSDRETNDWLVSVFKTDDPAVVPLATMALEAEGIEYMLTNSGKVDSMNWVMSQKPTTRPVVLEIKVVSALAAKARDLLADLEQSQPNTPPPDANNLATEALTSESPSIQLEDAATGGVIGAITEGQLQEITSHLEEDEPQQYFIDGATVDMLQGAGVEQQLIELLRKAVPSDGSGVALRWAVR